MPLKHRAQIKLPDISIAEGQGTQKVFEQLIRWLYDTSKNIYDDLVNNGVVRYNFDNELQLLAGLKLKRTAVAASPYTVLLTDHYIGVDTGAARTLNLPALATAGVGKEYIIKDETGTANANNITIDGSGAENIDGAATLVISTNYGKARIVAGPTKWMTI